MNNINVNQCSLCKDIWNSANLVKFDIGNHKLCLCPDCAKDFKEFVEKQKLEKN